MSDPWTRSTRRRLEQMAGLELGWRARLAEALAWPVALVAMILSYRAEVDLGQSLHAFAGWPAFLWPFAADAADVMLLVLTIEYRRLRVSTWKVDLGLVACTGVMIAANVRAVWPDPTAVAMQAWAPAIALWIFHTLATGRKPRGAPIDLGAVWAALPDHLRLNRPADRPADAVGAAQPGAAGRAARRQGGVTPPVSEASAAVQPARQPARQRGVSDRAGNTSTAGQSDVQADGHLTRREPVKVTPRLTGARGSEAGQDDVQGAGQAARQKSVTKARTTAARSRQLRRAGTLVAQEPNISGAELGRRLRVSTATGQRLLRELADAAEPAPYSVLSGRGEEA